MAFKEGIMKCRFLNIALFQLILGIFSLSAYAIPMSTADLWDVSQGTSVICDSGMLSTTSYISNHMFGGISGSGEPENAIFANKAHGTTHWVEWQTSAPITLKSFNLVASHDGTYPDDGIAYRGFSRFELFYRDSLGNWSLIHSHITDPDGDRVYGGGPSYPWWAWMELSVNISPIEAQYFRAEFIQEGSMGSRVQELDGYDYFIQPVPEPATMLLLGTGLVGLMVTGRRKFLRK